MDDHSLIRELVKRATKTRTQKEIAASCPAIRTRSLSRWINGDPFPNVTQTLELLRVCQATEDEIEKAIHSTKAWKNYPIPPPPPKSDLSDHDFLNICQDYSRQYLALRGTGMDKVAYKERFGNDGIEFIEKIRKSRYFHEGETTFTLGQTPFRTPKERGRNLKIMSQEHLDRVESGIEERGTIAICKAPVRQKTFDKIRDLYIPLWAKALDLVNADQADQSTNEPKIVFSFGSFLDIYGSDERMEEPPNSEEEQ